MKKLLVKLISGCQKAYQNTSNIGEIILDILENIALCNYHKTPAIILLIDFSKAFDSISHDYIYESLKFFNFGEYYINSENRYAYKRITCCAVPQRKAPGCASSQYKKKNSNCGGHPTIQRTQLFINFKK